MQKVNVVFDDVFDDADLILVPKRCVNAIREIEYAFNHWLQSDQNTEFWGIASDGRPCVDCETVGLIYWLNTYYRLPDEPLAEILQQHTDYNPEYPSFEF
jgi:hypothetical protein